LLPRGLPGEANDIGPRRSEGAELISKAARLGCAPARARYGGPLLKQVAVDAADARVDEDGGSCYQLTQRDTSAVCGGQLDRR
jgi:hypothetical protein